MTEVIVNRRIYHINDLVGNVRDTQLCFEPLADADLGFRMWGGKDDTGYETLFLSKDENAKVLKLWLNDASTMGAVGFLKHDADGLVSGLNDVVESIVVGAATPATGALTFAGAVTQDGSTFTFEGGAGGDALDAAYRFDLPLSRFVTVDTGAATWTVPLGGTTPASTFGNEAIANASPVVVINNDCEWDTGVEPYGIYFSGTAGNGYNSLGHRIWTDGSISIGASKGTSTEIRRAYFSVQDDYTESMPSALALMRAESYTDYARYAWLRVASGDYEALGPRIDGETTGFIDLYAAQYAVLETAGKIYLRATHVDFEQSSVIDMLNASFGPSFGAATFDTATITADWTASNYQSSEITANVTTVTFSNPPPGVASLTLIVFADATARTVTGFPASVTWMGGEDPDASPVPIPAGKRVTFQFIYDPDTTSYQGVVLREFGQYPEYGAGGALDDAYRFDLPDSKSVTADNGAVSIVTGADNGALALSHLATDRTADLFSILNNSVAANSAYFSGDAGEVAVDTIGHKIYFADQAAAPGAGALCNGFTDTTHDIVLSAHAGVQQTEYLSALRAASVLYADSDDGKFARVSALSGGWREDGVQKAYIYLQTNGYIRQECDSAWRAITASTATLQATGNIYFASDGYVGFQNTPIRAVQQLTCAAECDDETSSSGILNIDLSSGSPNRRIEMTENITRVNITKPVGQGRFTLYFESDGGGPYTLADFRDAGTTSQYLTWYRAYEISTPDDGAYTVPNYGSVMIDINYYKNSPVKASAILYEWEQPS